MRRYRQLLQESQRAPNDEDEPVEEFGDESGANTLPGLMRQIARDIEVEIADEVLGRKRTDG